MRVLERDLRDFSALDRATFLFQLKRPQLELRSSRAARVIGSRLHQIIPTGMIVGAPVDLLQIVGQLNLSLAVHRNCKQLQHVLFLAIAAEDDPLVVR